MLTVPVFALTGVLVSASLLVAQDGRQIFAARCAVCHGANARGSSRGPSLAGNPKVRARSIDELRGVIRNGIPQSGMPRFDLPDADLVAVTNLLRSLSAAAADANLPGDRAAGERYFFGAGGCANCHMLMGRGKAVGPDLSAIGRDLTAAEIEDAVFQPEAIIKPGYQMLTVKLRDGRTVRGFARNQSRYNLQLQDLAGQFHFLTQDQIGEWTKEKSLMQAPRCTADEHRDLLAFLATQTGVETGKPANAMSSPGGLTWEQILHPKPGDWPTYHGRLTGNRHNALDQINTANVKDVVLKWMFPINHFGLQLTPVVVDGTMFVTGPNQVFALDAQTGRPIWHFQRPRSPEAIGDPGVGTNRGVAVLGDRVFYVTDNAHLLALHRLTGQLLWETRMPPDGPQNNGATTAPLVVKDMVISGVSGGDQGINGFISAYKAATGERVWRFWTTPKPGEPNAETWKGNDLQHAGGATWMPGTYDEDTDTVFWGVGNPWPASNGDNRQGDNLYTASTLALDPATGKLKWYFQFTPHDLHDWDGMQTPMVVNRRYRGEERKLLIQPNRNGFFYVLDRTNGKMLLAEKFVDKLNWASGIDASGRPVVLHESDPTPEGVRGCPAGAGATNWMSTAFNPSTGLFYLMALEDCDTAIKDGSTWHPRFIQPEAGQKFLRAIDIETGKRVWEVPQIGPATSWGGVLSTGGGVVFFGEDSGAFAAVDARTGKDLWQFQTNHNWRASPMTFLAGGKQYVAVAAGPTILCFGLK